MLCGSRGLGGWFLAVALVETIDASGCVHQLLLSGEERMTFVADFYLKVTDGGTGLKCVAANARHRGSQIRRMNIFSHEKTPFRGKN